MIKIGAVSIDDYRQRTISKKYGENVTIRLDPNRKLDEFMWNVEDIWYLTRRMRDEEEARTYKFPIEGGIVTFIESKEGD